MRKIIDIEEPQYNTPLFTECKHVLNHSQITDHPNITLRDLGLNPEATHSIIVQSYEQHTKEEVLKLMQLAPHESIYVVEYKEFEHYGHGFKFKGYSYRADIIVSGYVSPADLGAITERVYSINEAGVLSKDFTTNQLSKYAYIDPLEGENLRVVIHADNVDTIYSLEELLKITGIKGDVIYFKPTVTDGTLPDTRRYTIHMKRQLPVYPNI